MAKLNVILEARGRDRGAARQLRNLTSLADKFADSATRARAAARGLGDAAGSIPAGGRSRGRGGRGGAAPAMGGGRARSSSGRAEREFDRALDVAIKEQRAIGRQLTRQARDQRRASKNVANLTDEQLVAVELEREQNSRRRRAARQTAKSRLGPDPTAARMSGFSKLEFAENLAVAGAEFEQFGAKIQSGVESSVASFRDYEKGVVEVSTLTDQIPIEQITKITSDAAAQFGGLPTEQVKAFYSIVSAGASTAAEAQAQLDAANKLAIGGVASQEEAVLAISKSVANFGVTSENASDIMFAAVQRGQTTVSEMAQSLPLVANSASRAGLSMEETAAAISFLSLKMKSSATASTGLNQALVNISKPSKMAREEAKRLGIDFSAAGIKAAGGLEAWVLQIASAEKYSAQTLGRLFESSEAQSAIGGLVQDLGGFHSVLTDATGSAGKAEAAYSKMAGTTAQKTAQLEAQFELLKIQAGEALVPALLELSASIMPVITGLRDWIKENPNTAATLGKLAIGIGIGAKAIGGLTSAMSMWSAISGIVQIKTTALGTSVATSNAQIGNATTGVTKYSRAAGGMRSLVGALPGVFAAASIGITAFNLTLDAAQKPLTEYEGTLKDIEEQQRNIAFQREANAQERADFEEKRAIKIAELEKHLEGAKSRKERKAIKEAIAAAEGAQLGKVTKGEEELLLERRNRMIQQVNAARVATREAKGGGAAETFLGGDTIEGIGQAFGGVLNRASGVAGELESQQRQAEIDLARFDQQYGAQLNLGEATFTTEATSSGFTGDTGTLAALAELVAATKMVAANTSQSTGPSMEAGLT